MRIIAGEYDIHENSDSQLLSFFEPQRNRGLSPHSCTVDGNPQVIRTLRAVWPDILIQRCLVHIQRQGLRWCRSNPKRTDAKKLREIFLKVCSIRNETDKVYFLELVESWEQNYGFKISKQPEKGRVFSDIKRARSMLLKALPDMFYYLQNPNIPRTTNGVEGYFSRLKTQYRNHRGLSVMKRKNYFKWYFYLKTK